MNGAGYPYRHFPWNRVGQGALACPPAGQPYGTPAFAAQPCGLPESYFAGCRVYGIPLDSLAAVPVAPAAGSTVGVVAAPQKPFAPQLLVVSSDISPAFLITAPSIGVDPQTVALGAYAATMFSEVAVNNVGNMDPIVPGQTITVTVTNQFGLVATRFLGMLWGTVQRS
jgi:hypothetical protein